MVLEMAGWPMLKSRAADENEPAFTTPTNISISRKRSIAWPGGLHIPFRNKSYYPGSVTRMAAEESTGTHQAKR
jgi:hypothetical protein